jgi:DNA-binding NarL/FixJ family response regulator
MTATRILLADDHRLVRAGIRSLVEKIPGVDVVAEASDGREAIELVRKHLPKIVLMDIAMRGLNGLDAAARIAKNFPSVKVIMLSGYSNEEYVLQALRSGASGYLLKDAALEELRLALAAVGRDETFISPAVSRAVINSYLAHTNAAPSLLETLTSRQREILQLIAEGKSTKEIAFLLNLSIKTVEAHRSQIMNRLDIHDVSGLVRFAIRAGLVSP